LGIVGKEHTMTPLDYLAIGYALIPCRADKAPSCPHGLHDAAHTPEEWAALSAAYPGPNLGLVIPDGVVVIDVDLDPAKGIDGRAELCRILPTFSEIVWPGPVQRTPRRGHHLWGSSSAITGNGRGSLPPGVDVRANGRGYVCVEPSRTERGAYQWITPLVEPFLLPPLPEWISTLILTPKHQIQSGSKVDPKSGSKERIQSGLPLEQRRKESYGRAALARAEEEIRASVQGERNHTLNTVAYSIGRLVAGGILDDREARNALAAAGRVVGLAEHEINRTIDSGFRAGSAEPRELPPGSLTSVAGSGDRAAASGGGGPTGEAPHHHGPTAEAHPEPMTREPGSDDNRDPWPELRPLPPKTHPAPPMDPAILPDSLRDWIVDVMEAASAPLEYAAIPAMVALGAVIGRKVGICPGGFEPAWCIPGNLWGAIVGDSGIKKTMGIKRGLAHLQPLEWALREEWEAVGPSFMAKRVSLEKLAKGGKGIDEREIEGAIRELQRIPTGAKRLKTNDSTVEKLAMILNENTDGILIVREELTAWLQLMDRAGREGDRPFYLEGWNGDGSFTQDRVSRPTIHVPAVCLSVIGGIQPGPLAEHVSGAMGGGGRADGMLQRFQLLAWPDQIPDFRKNERWPNESAATRAEGAYLRLHKATAQALGGEARTKSARIPGLLFDAQGQATYDHWQREIEARMRSDEFAGRGALKSHISKYRSLTPKLAMVLHLADNPTGPIGELATLRAVHWVRWLEQHARKVYAPEETDAMRGARALAEKIQTGALGEEITVRDVYRHGSKAKTDAAIKVLTEYGWTRILTKPTKGRPRNILEINPAAMVGL
jgi:putative DNA primase/helicase